MSASARLLRPPVRNRPRPPVPETDATVGKKSKKDFTYRGICITCGEKIEIQSDKMEISFFAFCNGDCKAKFDQEMNEEID